jgi:hypothetical protein
VTTLTAAFDLLFRKSPFSGEFTIFAGLEECLRFISNFTFTDGDIEYLRKCVISTIQPPPPSATLLPPPSSGRKHNLAFLETGNSDTSEKKRVASLHFLISPLPKTLSPSPSRCHRHHVPDPIPRPIPLPQTASLSRKRWSPRSSTTSRSWTVASSRWGSAYKPFYPSGETVLPIR